MTQFNASVGRISAGLSYARHGNYRVLLYADGGHCQTVWRGDHWGLFPGQEGIPVPILRRLLAELGVRYEDWYTTEKS